MKPNIIVIRILLVVSLVSALATMPLSYCQSNCAKWGYLWGNAITIGVFASSFVALVSECIHYINQKNAIEKNLYRNVALVYMKLRTIYAEINRTYIKPEQMLGPSFLKPQTLDINNVLIQITFDINTYDTFRHSTVASSIEQFRQYTYSKISDILMAMKAVELAINEDILDEYKSNLESFNQYKRGQSYNYTEQQPLITSSSPHTNKALNNVTGLITDELFDSIESILLSISKRKSNNFDWKKDKERILSLVE